MKTRQKSVQKFNTASRHRSNRPHSALRVPHFALEAPHSRQRTCRAEAGRRRTGKIARLPKRCRDLVNRLLQEGVPYFDIIHALEDKPEFRHAISKQNLSNWKKGGYQDWLENQQWITQTRLDQDFALDLLDKNEKTPIHEATLHVAVTQIARALRRFDPATLEAALKDQPSNYLRLLDVLAKLSYTGLNCEHRRQEKPSERKSGTRLSTSFWQRRKPPSEPRPQN